MKERICKIPIKGVVELLDDDDEMRANLEAVCRLRRPTSWRIARCCIVRCSMVRLPFPACPIRRYRDDNFPSLPPPGSSVVEKDYLYDTDTVTRSHSCDADNRLLFDRVADLSSNRTVLLLLPLPSRETRSRATAWFASNRIS